MSDKGLLELMEMGVVAEDASFKDGAEEKLSVFERLGFKKLADQMKAKIEKVKKERAIHFHGYIGIEPKQIQAFLDRKAKAYNEKNKTKEKKEKRSEISGVIFDEAGGINTSIWRQCAQSIQVQYYNDVFTDAGDTIRIPSFSSVKFYAPTIHSASTDPKLIGNFVWNEVPVESYEAVPPQNVLEAFETHKERKCFDYFTIASVKGIPDPVLLGRLNGSEIRYWVINWGDDVPLDDIL